MKHLSIAALILCVSAAGAAANRILYVRDLVEEMNQRYEALDRFDVETPGYAAHRMLELRTIRQLYDWAAFGTARMTDMSRTLRLTPEQAVPALEIPIETQIERHFEQIIEFIESCAETPEPDCLFDSAAALSTLSGSFDEIAASLSFELYYLSLPIDAPRADRLLEMIDAAARMTLRLVESENRNSTPTFYGPVVQGLFNTGRERQSYRYLTELLRDFPDPETGYEAEIGTIDAARRWRQGKLSRQEMIEALAANVEGRPESEQPPGIWLALSATKNLGMDEEFAAWAGYAVKVFPQDSHVALATFFLKYGYDTLATPLEPQRILDDADIKEERSPYIIADLLLLASRLGDREKYQALKAKTVQLMREEVGRGGAEPYLPYQLQALAEAMTLME